MRALEELQDSSARAPGSEKSSMEARKFGAARGAYVVFGGINGALALLWLGVAWKAGSVTWGPLVLLAVSYVLCVLWLSRFGIELTAEELRFVQPFGGERRIARADILGVEFVAPKTRNEGPFTLAIRVRDGEELRLNAKLFTREAVQLLLGLAPATQCAA